MSVVQSDQFPTSLPRQNGYLVKRNFDDAAIALGAIVSARVLDKYAAHHLRGYGDFTCSFKKAPGVSPSEHRADNFDPACQLRGVRLTNQQ